jgi:hypothetical protein
LFTITIESGAPGEKPATNSCRLGTALQAGIQFIIYKTAAHKFESAVRYKVMYNERKHDGYEDYTQLPTGLDRWTIFFPVSHSEIVYAKFNTGVSVEHQQFF